MTIDKAREIAELLEERDRVISAYVAMGSGVGMIVHVYDFRSHPPYSYVDINKLSPELNNQIVKIIIEKLKDRADVLKQEIEDSEFDFSTKVGTQTELPRMGTGWRDLP